MASLKSASERLLRDIESRFAVSAGLSQGGDKPRDVPVVQDTDRLRVAAATSKRLCVGEAAHTG